MKATLTLYTGKVVHAHWTDGCNGIEEYGCEEYDTLTIAESCDLYRQILARAEEERERDLFSGAFAGTEVLDHVED